MTYCQAVWFSLVDQVVQSDKPVVKMHRLYIGVDRMTCQNLECVRNGSCESEMRGQNEFVVSETCVE